MNVRIIEDIRMVDHVEDWSRVRSKGRAARRRHKHRQNIRTIAVPKTHVTVMADGVMVMHPEAARQLRAAMAALPKGPRS